MAYNYSCLQSLDKSVHRSINSSSPSHTIIQQRRSYEATISCHQEQTTYGCQTWLLNHNSNSSSRYASQFCISVLQPRRHQHHGQGHTPLCILLLAFLSTTHQPPGNCRRSYTYACTHSAPGTSHHREAAWSTPVASAEEASLARSQLGERGSPVQRRAPTGLASGEGQSKPPDGMNPET